MPRMPPGGENRASKKGEAKVHGQPKSVAGIEGEHKHAGERGPNKGVVFKIPQSGPDHSCVHSPEHK